MRKYIGLQASNIVGQIIQLVNNYRLLNEHSYEYKREKIRKQMFKYTNDIILAFKILK